MAKKLGYGGLGNTNGARDFSGKIPAPDVVTGVAPFHTGRANWHILDNVRKRRFGQKSILNDETAGIGIDVSSSTGRYDLQTGTSTEIGGFFLVQSDTDLTDNSGGSATGTIGAMTNVDTLTDSTTGTADDTLVAISGSGDDANINNNFKELIDQIITQRALNTVLIDSVASLAADNNDLRSKMRTSGILDS